MELIASLTILRTTSNGSDSYSYQLDWAIPSPFFPAQTVVTPQTLAGSVVVEAELQAELQQRIDTTVEVLGLLNKDPGMPGANDEALENLGKLLFARLLPIRIQGALSSLPADLPLSLVTNDHLPWELLHDGHGFLALQRPVGRRLVGAALPRPPLAYSNAHRRILIIADPRGNLSAARQEGGVLLTLFDTSQDDIETELLGSKQATLAAVREKLAGGRYDVIHYAGHAAANSLLLADGELAASEIATGLRGQPIVFLNACRSAFESDATDLTAAFVQGGALAVVGTLRNVEDSGSNDFARWFYGLLLNGLPLGEALRQARIRLNAGSPNPLWANYMLYGDPRLLVLGLESRVARQATVMVARLSGLRSLFLRHSLERAALLHEEAVAVVVAIAERFGGHTQELLTDTMVLRFGVPDRREDDVQRAMITAFEMTQALDQFSLQYADQLSEPIHIRIGISTGQVVSKRIRTPSGFDYLITSDIIDMAGRLAEASAPSEMMVDELSQRLGGDTFPYGGPREILSLPDHPTADIIAFRVPTHGQGRGQEHARGQLSATAFALYGRDREIVELQRWWSESRAGLFRFVEIVGAPGVGKTRLVTAFRTTAFNTTALGNTASAVATGDDGSSWISVRCQTHEQESSYSLLSQIIHRLIGTTAVDDPELLLLKLRATVEAALQSTLTGDEPKIGEEPVQEGVALIAQVLGLSYTVPSIATLAADLRQKKLSATIQALINAAAASPIVLVLEDLHWADDASLRVLEESLGRAGRLPILCLALHRPDWTTPWASKPWAGSPNTRHLTLVELDLPAQKAMLVEFLGGDPGSLSERILAYTGGNPLFIEETARSLVESGAIERDGDSWRLSGELEGFLPDRLETVIQARLDRLPATTRQAVRLAAVIGREFERPLLSNLQSEAARETLDSDLDGLMARSIIEIVGGFYPNLAYAFTHALIQQTAYENVPKTRRQSLHRVVGRALEGNLPEHPAATINPNLVAHHYYYSDDRISAIRWCLAAGARAADLWDNAASLTWYARVRQLLDDVAVHPPSPIELRGSVTALTLNQWRLAALEGSAGVQWKVGDHGIAETNFREALVLARTDQEFGREVRARLCYQLIHLYEAQGEYDRAWEALQEGLAEVVGEERIEAGQLYIWRGLIHHRRGEPEEAIAWCQRGIVIAEQENSLRDQAMGHNLLAIIFRVQGQTEKARLAAETSLSLYSQEGYIPGVERATSNLACVYQDMQDWSEASRLFEESRDLSERTGEVFRLAGAYTNLGEVARLQGDSSTAVHWYDQGRQMAQRHGLDEIEAILVMNSGAVLLAQGLAADAWAKLDESRGLFESIGSRQYLSEVFRYMAEARLVQQEIVAAESLANQARQLAIEMGREIEQQEAESLLARILDRKAT